jgi:hypothetical protein
VLCHALNTPRLQIEHHIVTGDDMDVPSSDPSLI